MILALALLAVFVIGFGIVANYAIDGDLSGLELILFQVVLALFGVAGSFIGGREQVRSAAENAFKPVAKSAFRRVKSLHRALNNILNYNQSDIVDALVREQIDISIDIMKDWHDIVPEELEKLMEEINPEGDDD